jgi:hypothetical protein
MILKQAANTIFINTRIANAFKINKITGTGVTQSYPVKSIKGFDSVSLTIKPGLTYSLTVSYIKSNK